MRGGSLGFELFSTFPLSRGAALARMVLLRQSRLRHSAFSLTLQQLTQPGGHKEAAQGPYATPYGPQHPRKEPRGVWQ